jgi:hypothetical protein
MEHGKLERSQRALEQWVKEHPEEVRRLREQAKPLAEFLNSPEWDAFWQPAKAAILHDDEDGVYVWAETRIGRKPDFVIKVSYLGKKELGDATPRETWVLVDDRGEKLAGEARGEPDDEGIAVFGEKTKTFGRLKRVRSEFTDPDDWEREIAKAVLKAGAESPHGYPLTLGEIEWRIERDNRWRGLKGTPGEDSPRVKDARARVRAAEERAFGGNLKPQEHRGAVEALRTAERELEKAISFASTASLSTGGPGGGAMRVAEGPRHRGVWGGLRVGRGERPVPEWEEKMLDRLFLAHYASPENPAGLSPGELEVFRLAIQLEHREIAEEIGRTEGLVRKLKHQAVKKVRKHGEITVRDHIDTNARKRGRTKKSA